MTMLFRLNEDPFAVNEHQKVWNKSGIVGCWYSWEIYLDKSKFLRNMTIVCIQMTEVKPSFYFNERSSAERSCIRRDKVVSTRCFGAT